MVEQSKNDEEIKDETFVEVPAILEKFKAAAAVTDAALKHGMTLLVAGADVYTVCQTVDAMIESEIQKTFNSKKTKNIERGIAFPCCLSVNNVVGHYSPLADESVKLQDGDIAKLICGSHIDGYAATSASTVVVGDAKVTGRKADVILAAQHALLAAQRVIKDGATNHEVTEVINKVVAEYEVNLVEGVLSHTIKKFCIDGNKCIISKETPTQNVEEWIFAPGDVIGLDIYVSSGEGKPKQSESRTSVYKRELQNTYSLKLQKSRAFFAEANKRFPSLCFSLRAFEDQTGAKVGVSECVNHELLVPYPVLEEKKGDFVAHFKSTVAILPRSTAVISGDITFDEKRFEGEHSLKSEELKTLISSALWKKEDKKKK